ncbi:hypothetical protein SAMN02745163_01563 [Clostridium cavendishii DSM 21758]|uniref:Phage tail tube protein n=1 Tax=Clostridium cavendishii DSM 21758 TaxID=1121302 RepID=A0A1M6HSE6_9CLOT|nr:hypothetical protein [Clostridium cavendishii]SHJ25098.1 hypothetical protein SAMN02745163_01563 [Clostridium cavendishii DSM 21758]
MSKNIKRRNGIANYLNVGTGNEEYVLMGAGFTELKEVPASQVSSKKYITDKSATKRIIGYDWTTSFNTDQIRDEKAVEFICNVGEKQLVGEGCETDYVIVDLDKKSTIANEYKARKFRVAIEVAEFPTSDEGDLTATGNLHAVGDLVSGTFNTVTKKFTPETSEVKGV